MALQWKEILRSDGDLVGKVNNVAVGTVTTGAAAGTTAKVVTDAAFTSNILDEANAHANLKNSSVSISAAGLLSGGNVGGGTVTPAGLDVIERDGTGAPNSLKNNQITLTASSGTVTLNNAGSGSLTKTSLNLGNVLNQAQTSTFKQDAVPTALAAGDLWVDSNDNNKQYRATAAGDDAVEAGEWVEVSIGKAALGLVKADVGLTNVADANIATIMGNNLTGTIGGVANSTVRSGAASGATANQESTASILGGNLTGTIGGTANATVLSGAAKGITAPVTFAQDAIPVSLNIGDVWFDTNDSNKQYRAASVGADAVTSGEWILVTIAKGGLGLVKADVGLTNVADESPATLKTTMSLNNVDNSNTATILGGNLTGTIGGVANATVRSGAASGATANQSSTATILSGNLTGTVGGTANATVLSGAAKGLTSPVTFAQDAVPTALNAGDTWFDTNDSNKQYRATQTGDDAVTSGEWVSVVQGKIHTYSKGDVGLTNVIDQAVTVVSGKLKFGASTQTLDADTIDGDSKATIKSAAVTTAKSDIIGAAPDGLNTLVELAASLGDDASYASTITTSLAAKQGSHVVMSNATTPAATGYAVGRTGTFSNKLFVVVDE